VRDVFSRLAPAFRAAWRAWIAVMRGLPAPVVEVPLPLKAGTGAARFQVWATLANGVEKCVFEGSLGALAREHYEGMRQKPGIVKVEFWDGDNMRGSWAA
jgi:hypothetical protein